MLLVDFPSIVVDDQQVRNCIAGLKTKAESGGHCRRLLERLLKRRHSEDPELSIEQLLDDQDRLRGVLWVTGHQRHAWVSVGMMC